MSRKIMTEEEMKSDKFHRRVDELICNWSTLMQHPFTEEELNSLVDLIGDDIKLQAIKIHACGVRAGKVIESIQSAPNRKGVGE